MVKIKKTGDEEFLHERTQQLLSQWADNQLQFGKCFVTPGGIEKDKGKIYSDYALSKGWLSKRNPDQITQSGFKQAARFLRR